jgi:malate dehydrogenase (oxaloacetate-decarboxylating)
MNWDKRSDDLHRSNRGKIRINPIIPLDDKDNLSTAYTPGVASPTKHIARDEANADIYTSRKRNVAIATNGTAVLGLGNTGAAASIPVMEGKAALFKRLAGIDGYPLPVNETNPEAFTDTVERLTSYYNGINLEDIKAPECFTILHDLQERLDIPVFHDDQHGTAIVILAALINAATIRPVSHDDKIVITGAGAAGIATADLLSHAGHTDIVVTDSTGILHPSRDDMNEHKQRIARKTRPDNPGGLDDAIEDATVFIGVSTGGILSHGHVKRMADDPITFALSNPTPEIEPETAEEAGASIIATGRSDHPNQVNNALVFPGLFNGLIEADKNNVTYDDMTRVAHAIANTVTPEADNILPSVFNDDVVPAVTRALAD